MSTDKLNKIKEILKGVYKDKMSDVTIDSFAKALHYSLFVGQDDLDDIPATIFEYESEEGIEGEDWCYLFGQLIDLLDDNEITAKRLYKSFMHEFDLLDTFLKLVNLNAEYLSVEELAQAKGKAFGLFDRQMLEDCGIEEE